LRAKTTAVVLVAIAGMVGPSCGTTQADPFADNSSQTTATQRAARVVTSGCGWASARTGSGVALEDGIVITVAHMVVRADTVTVSVGEGQAVAADITAIDLERDLAMLRLPPSGITRAEAAPISPGADSGGSVVGGATSGTVAFTGRQAARISIEEVLGTQRHERLGYELDVVTARGDSGAGVYDDRGRLVGIVFATSDNGTTTWATAVSEVLAFVVENQSATLPLACDAAESALSILE